MLIGMFVINIIIFLCFDLYLCLFSLVVKLFS